MNRLKILLGSKSFGWLLLASIIFLHTGTVSVAGSGVSVPLAQFEKWCKQYKEENGFCVDKCDKGLNNANECELDLPFDYEGMSPRQRMYACDYYSPFGAKYVVRSRNGDLLCKYESTTYCTDRQDLQIGNSCFRLTATPTLQFKDAECPQGYKMMNGKSEKENRWVASLLNHGGNPVWINGTGRTPPVNSMLTKIDGFVGEEIGTLVHFGEDAMVKRNVLQHAVCHKSSARVPFEEMKRSNELQFMLTSNLVQPDGTPEIPSVKKYHEYCKNVFPGSIAAYPDHVKQYLKLQNKMKIVHVAGQYKSTADVQRKANSDCNTPLKTTVVRTRFATAAAANGSEKAIADTSYVNNYPNNRCADTVRSILTIHNGKLSGLIDEPATARHRLLCVRGSKVALGNLASNRCGDRAVPDGLYDCKCKDGYTDAYNISSFANKDSYRKGELCYKSNCKDIQRKMHVILMIDISGSESGDPCNQAIRYFKQIPDLIPNTAQIDLIKWDTSARLFSFKSSDKNAEMEGLLNYETCQGRGTSPMYAMRTAYKLFEKSKSDINIVVSTTDGDGGYDTDWVQTKLLNELKVNMIFVHNGKHDYNSVKLQKMTNPDKLSTNYIRIRGGSQGMSPDHFKMLILQQCNPDLNEIA